MKTIFHGNNESHRLSVLDDYQIMYTQKEYAFDRITELAKQFFGTLFVAITFLDKDKQFYKSITGLDIEENSCSRDLAFCHYTILQDEAFVVLDTLLDERFCNNPFVNLAPFVRFYAGVPILVPDNDGNLVALGSLCLIDDKPRESFLEAERQALLKFADIVSDTLCLRKQQRQAKHASEMKSAFLANMSHEIRTPMNGIMGMLDLLSQTQINEQQKEYIKYIQHSNEHLLNIVNDILDLSKIESGKMEFETIDVDLKQLCEQITSIFMVHAKSADIELSFDYPDDLPHYVKTDPVRVRQILVNLVHNAIKFTPKKGKVRLQAIGCADNGEIKLQVIDTGRGIRSDSQKVIFDAYNQADKFTHRIYGGTGLGLSVCKALAEGMGGTILLESEEGKGSTFSLCLPLLLVDETLFQQKNVCLSDKNQRYKRFIAHILLAEDNHLNAMVAMKSLKKFGYTVDLAKDGKEALDMYQQNPSKYQMILMDHQMPIMDGVEATKMLRRKFEKLPPIIAVTAHAMHGDKDIYIKAGMQDYLTKPYKPEALDDMIQAWLKKSVMA